MSDGRIRQNGISVDGHGRHFMEAISRAVVRTNGTPAVSAIYERQSLGH